MLVALSSAHYPSKSEPIRARRSDVTATPCTKADELALRTVTDNSRNSGCGESRASIYRLAANETSTSDNKNAEEELIRKQKA